MVQVKSRNTPWTRINIWILAILIFLIFPGIILIIPIYIFRYLVALYSQYFKPDLGELLNSLSAAFATDDMYNKPRSTIVSFVVIEGKPDLQEVRQYAMGKIVERDSSTGELKVPEGQQYVSTWMGFYFWKWDPVFQIENHVMENDEHVSCKCLNQRSLHQINNELIAKPWRNKQSPWELMLYPNYQCKNETTPLLPKTLVVFRWHHTGMDGMSPLKLFFTDRAGVKPDIPRPVIVKKNVFPKILNALTFIFRFPHDVSTLLVKSSDPFSPFHKHQNQLSRRNNLVTSGKIPLSKIKEVRDWNRTSFACVVIAAFTGALRTLIIEQWGEVPEYISATVAMPLPGNSDKLIRNNITGIIASLPVGLPDPEMRLRAIETNLENLKNSTLPYFIFLSFKAIGSLPAFIASFITKHHGPTADIAIIPAHSNEALLFGLPVVDITFNVGHGPGHTGIGLATLSYNGNIRFTIGIDESILPESENNIEGVMESMLEELNLLKQHKTV